MILNTLIIIFPSGAFFTYHVDGRMNETGNWCKNRNVNMKKMQWRKCNEENTMKKIQWNNAIFFFFFFSSSFSSFSSFLLCLLFFFVFFSSLSSFLLFLLFFFVFFSSFSSSSSSSSSSYGHYHIVQDFILVTVFFPFYLLKLLFIST